VYPERRAFRVRFLDATDLIAECSQIEHQGFMWRLVRISSEDGRLREAHVHEARRIFFEEDAEILLEGNPLTGRARLSQKLDPVEDDAATGDASPDTEGGAEPLADRDGNGSEAAGE
jgi:hypothetical protein